MATQPDTSTVQEVVVAPPEEEAPQRAAIEGRSLGQIAWTPPQEGQGRDGRRHLRRVPVAAGRVRPLAVRRIIGLIAHPVNEYHQNAIDPNLGGIPPIGTFGGISKDFLLGVQPVTGRDMFSQIIYGARVSLLVAFLATILVGGHRRAARHHRRLLRRLRSTR